MSSKITPGGTHSSSIFDCNFHDWDQVNVWSWDSLLVRVPDSWSKGWIPAGAAGEFSSPELSLCADSYSVSVPLLCLFHSCVTAVARKRPRSFCQKCRWRVTPKQAYNEVGVGWLCHRPSIVWELIKKRAHTQLVREHSATAVSARWATVDWSCCK